MSWLKDVADHTPSLPGSARGLSRIEAVAKAAGVGKPAIYRRFREKAGLVAHMISRQLPPLQPPGLGDSRAELWRAVEQGLPADGPSYVGLTGGLIAEQGRDPELISAFRERILLPPPRDRAIDRRARTEAWRHPR